MASVVEDCGSNGFHAYAVKLEEEHEAKRVMVNPMQLSRIHKRREERTQRIALRPNAPRQKYLHESRHKHALNRVRGHKGRF
mmetsp:Transcript_54759/g.131247  ORF Transcript_54759/g.131247 Transcript_54759/m.131247 type:complete len:82 (+) Transcript_54759:34-279(+)